MDLKIDFKKGTETVSGALQKTTEISKKFSDTVQEKAKNLSEKNRNGNYLKRLKKYNPLFPEKFYSEEFNLPNMIIIVDDAVRKGIDVCEGAIGWLSNEKGMEVLHLYDEETEKCGIKFVPAPVCDAAYYVDRFDRKRFIQVDYIFDRASEERLAELEHIAYSLGAKYCSIEINETEVKSNVKRNKTSSNQSAPVHSVKVSSETCVEQNSSMKKISNIKGKIETHFEGSNEIKIPSLKWFANDDNIRGLIQMRFDNANAIKRKTLELQCSSSSTMSKKTAVAIDDAVGSIGMGGKTNMEGKAFHESASKLIFYVEF